MEYNNKLIALIMVGGLSLRMGGGIKSLEHAKKVFNFGIEKIALRSIIHDNFKLISDGITSEPNFI